MKFRNKIVDFTFAFIPSKILPVDPNIFGRMFEVDQQLINTGWVDQKIMI